MNRWIAVVAATLCGGACADSADGAGGTTPGTNTGVQAPMTVMPGGVGSAGSGTSMVNPPGAGSSGAPIGVNMPPAMPGAAGAPGMMMGIAGANALAGAGGGIATAGSGPVTPPPPPGELCLQGSGDYTGAGPYGTGQMDVTIGSSGAFTIFYPEPLDTDCLHPIVAWGNGTGVTGSGTYAFYNTHAASWGIVVIASHNSNVGSGEFHKAGLDYLLAENAKAGSMFFGKLSPRAGTSGHSQGGMGANAGASHPNVEAEVNVQGAFGRAPGGVKFLCLTGTADINPAGCKSSVDGAAEPAMHANYEGADHVGTATIAGELGGDPGTRQYKRLYSAWFRCFLADDQGACALFMGGASCPVCGESGWAEIYSKNF
jgi:hypothetical protein